MRIKKKIGLTSFININLHKSLNTLMKIFKGFFKKKDQTSTLLYFHQYFVIFHNILFLLFFQFKINYCTISKLQDLYSFKQIKILLNLFKQNNCFLSN